MARGRAGETWVATTDGPRIPAPFPRIPAFHVKRARSTPGLGACRSRTTPHQPAPLLSSASPMVRGPGMTAHPNGLSTDGHASDTRSGCPRFRWTTGSSFGERAGGREDVSRETLSGLLLTGAEPRSVNPLVVIRSAGLRSLPTRSAEFRSLSARSAGFRSTIDIEQSSPSYHRHVSASVPHVGRARNHPSASPTGPLDERVRLSVNQSSGRAAAITIPVAGEYPPPIGPASLC